MSVENAHEQVFKAVVEDIARRLGIAADALRQVSEQVDGAYSFVGCEVAALQVRRVCETLLLASTAIHSAEDRYTLNDREWRPKNAFRQLNRISEHPLPMPVNVILDHNGPGEHHIVPSMRPMPFALLSEIYGMCGDMLHVPTLRQVIKGNIAVYEYDRLAAWVDGLSRLLRAHVLMLPKREIIMLCLWDGNFAQLPQVYRLDAEGESTFDLAEIKAFDLFS